MRKSSISSLILFLLAALSMGLSYLLYYDSISIQSIFNKNGDGEIAASLTTFIDSQDYTNQYKTTDLEFTQLSEPVRYIIKKDAQAYQIKNELALEQVNKYLSENPFEVFDQIGISEEDFLKTIYSQDYIQIDLPTSLALDSISILNNLSDQEYLDGKASQILIPLGDEEIAYFVDPREGIYYEAEFSPNLSSKELYLALETKSVDWQPVEAYMGKYSYIYLVQSGQKIDRERFVLETVPELQLLANTFVSDDYESVETDNPGVNSYQTYQFDLDVNTVQNTMTYKQTLMSEAEEKTSYQIMNQSYEVLKKYECWPYKLRVSQANPTKITYRRYYNGYPIYNTNMLASVDYSSSRVSLTKNNHRYDVPLSFPDIHLDDMCEPVELPSAYALVAILENLGMYLADFDDIFIAYEWRPYNREEDLCELVPTWYFSYNDKLYTLEEVQADEFINLYREGGD